MKEYQNDTGTHCTMIFDVEEIMVIQFVEWNLN